MFSNQTVKKIQFGAVTVSIRKLSWLELKTAALMREREAAAEAARMGPDIRAALIRRQIEVQTLQADNKGALPPPTIEERREARYYGFDRETVLRSGVVEWVGESNGVNVADKKLPDAVTGLDEETANLLHREILDLTLPPLEMAQQESVRKND